MCIFKNFKQKVRLSWYRWRIPVNPAWDKKLKWLLKRHDFTNISIHYAYLGRYKIWTTDKGYHCAFTLVEETPKYKGRPKEGTLIKAGDKLWRDRCYNLEFVEGLDIKKTGFYKQGFTK